MSHSASFSEFKDKLGRRNAIRAAMDNESITAVINGKMGGEEMPHIDPVTMARLTLECERVSAAEEGMTIQEYRILNGRHPITRESINNGV